MTIQFIRNSVGKPGLSRKEAPAAILSRRVGLAARDLPTHPHTGPTSPPLCALIAMPTPPTRPRQHSECAIFGTQKTHSVCCPRRSGQKPPPSAARHDRSPLNPAASAPFVCRCRNLAAFWTAPTHHPFETRDSHQTGAVRHPGYRRNAEIHT